jgi:UDP-N-acetylmuramoyl-tripeptide--D-alanyl-D-alanine ligase
MHGMIHDMQQFMLIALTAVDALLVILSQVALWQRKEYRLDRMKAYILSPEGSLKKQGASIVATIFLGVAWTTFLLNAFIIADVLSVASLLSVFIGHAVRIYRKGVFRPEPTSRALLVLLATVVLGAVGVFLLVTGGELLALQLATFVFLLPLFTALAVYLVGIPTQMQKQRVISRAIAYRNHLQNLSVVGITGSVGKTSTKTYLIHLLGGESEKIVATSEHRNSPYSVAQDMLSRLSQKTTIYIAEMGAYVQGEIAELCILTKPKIGVITAITNQHAALFGSIEALAQTKWELINSLPEDGVAILNKDDAQIGVQARNMKRKVLWFSAKGKADVSATHVVLHQDRTQCVLSIGNETHTITLPIISRGQLVPVLAAITTAHALGTDGASITERLATLPALPRTMELRTGKAGAIIVDDSYSASEASVTNAIDYLSSIGSEDTRLILVPVIELGEEGGAAHERMGKLLNELSAHVYIYGNEYKEDILLGLGNHPKAKVIWFDDAKKLKEKVIQGITRKTTIVLEGRIPSLVRTSLL